MEEPKKRRRCVATVRTSGLAESVLEKSRKKRNQKVKEMEVIKRAKEEKVKVLDKVGVDYFSDTEVSSSDDENKDGKEIFDVDEGDVTVDEEEFIRNNGYDYDDLFELKLDPKEEEESARKCDDNSSDIKVEVKIPVRRTTLYGIKDPRSSGPNSILTCRLCLEKSQMCLFTSTETLKAHLKSDHTTIYDWFCELLSK